MLSNFKSYTMQKKIILLLTVIAVCCILIAAGITVGKYYEGKKAQQAADKMLRYYNDAVAVQENSKNIVIKYEGYEVIGKLIIDKINISLPVISKYDTTALGVSVCYYKGALPGQDGNMVITGHNYANGAHFGKLDKLKIGDKVVLNTPDGEKYSYTVYDIETVKPDDVASLSKYEGQKALTLLTCTSNANRRLLVRCKII